MRLRLLRLMIGSNILCQFSNQGEAKPEPKSIEPFTVDFSRALSKLQVTPKNSDWFFDSSLKTTRYNIPN